MPFCAGQSFAALDNFPNSVVAEFAYLEIWRTTAPLAIPFAAREAGDGSVILLAKLDDHLYLDRDVENQ